MMTAHGSIESAVEAMKLGARDYLQKPFEVEELLVSPARPRDQRARTGLRYLLSERDADSITTASSAAAAPSST
jgi:DNA-binding NtrC family response regulator